MKGAIVSLVSDWMLWLAPVFLGNMKTAANQ
jgi:hypothetical protein